MTSFCEDIMGSRGFSLMGSEKYALLSLNPYLLVPIRSVIAYAKKQKSSGIFEWHEE